MDENQNVRVKAGLNRRNFIGALGAAAAAGAFLEASGSRVKAENAQTYYYRDSFGKIVPAGSGTLELGILPPPISNRAPTPQASQATPRDEQSSCSGTYYAPDYPKYNILLIMVDQMRNPNFWAPSSGSIIGPNGPIPNISALIESSWQFPNYFVPATVCGPSRACLLTGLYSQQTSIFRSERIGSSGSLARDVADAGGSSTSPPPLLPWSEAWTAGDPAGFPTIGNVLSQVLCNSAGGDSTYDCTWIGKWHVSCGTGFVDGTPGEYGPSDYGFKGMGDYTPGLGNFNIPNAASHNPYPRGLAQSTHLGYPSPNGMNNEGTGGDFLDSFAQATPERDLPNFGTTLPLTLPASLVQLNDAAIAWAFTNYWLPNAEKYLTGKSGGALAKPWFCAVSFINPHDIGGFPYTYGLTSGAGMCPITGTEPYCTPQQPNAQGYVYPPSAPNTQYTGTDCLNNCLTEGDETTIPPLPTSYSALPNPWNWEDQSGIPYTAGSGNNPKPGLQQFFLNQRNQTTGQIADPGINSSGWQTFLNYYLWMESCVDYQVGQVINALKSSSFFWNNTVIVFTSDHGEYGGSHGLRTKGGALYEEVLNVPLLISYPESRSHGKTPPSLPYVCSEVDLLPFFYSLALGNYSWVDNPDDIVYYLRDREAIGDAIYQYQHDSANLTVQQNRISSIPLHTPLVGTPTEDWQSYQPFVLHTADDYSSAPSTLGAQQPSHAIAFRTVDQTDPIPASLQQNGQTIYGGGKLGVYSYWDTCDATGAPLQPITQTSGSNPPDSQFEFYNFSPNPPGGDSPVPPVNVLEIGNTYLDGTAPNEVALYQDNFFASAPAHGVSVQDELYNNPYITQTANPQVWQAIQTAFSNYILYLNCTGQLTGSDGTIVDHSGCPTSPACTNCESSPPCGSYAGNP
jgi:arylsulfatase A-like enzyme